MERIKVIRTNYGIHPVHIEQVTENVYRIEDGQSQYSFKRSSLKKNRLKMWQHVLHEAYEKKLMTILPVYLTNDSNFFVTINGLIYYLSPWVNSDEINIEQMYQGLGEIHMKTKSVKSIKIEKIKKPFFDFKNICLTSQKKLLTYVEKFEQERYMSPFELQVCTQYRDIELVLKKIIEPLEHFTNNEQETIEWSNSLCHGQFAFSHVLTGKQLYMINWEKAEYGNATMDLIHLFKEEIRYYDSPVDDLLNLFPKYLQENVLSYDELMSLLIYLLNPLKYLELVEHYVNQTRTDSMIHMIRKLEYLYRQLIFGLKMTNQIELNYEETIQHDD